MNINRWRKALILTVLVLMTVSIITACSQESKSELVEGYFPGNSAPDFTLLQLDDTEVSLSDFEGKSVLLVFWASWWPSCNAEFPVLRKVYEDLDTSKYEIIGVNITASDKYEDVVTMIDFLDIQFPIALDYDGDVSLLYGIKTIPSNIFIGSDGIIRESIVGPVDESSIIQKLEEAY